MILTIEDVRKTIQNTLGNDLYANNIIRVGVFGSIARGEASEKSDVDLLIEYDYSKDISDYFYLCDEIRTEFRKKHKKEVSIVDSIALNYEENKHIGKAIERYVIWVWHQQKTEVGT